MPEQKPQGSELEKVMTRILSCPRAPAPTACFLPEKWEENDGKVTIAIQVLKNRSSFAQLRVHYNEPNLAHSALLEKHLKNRLERCGIPRGVYVKTNCTVSCRQDGNSVIIEAYRNGGKPPAGTMK